MKRKLLIPISAVLLIAGCLILTPTQQVSADPDPDFITAVESGEYDILFADAAQRQGPGGMNLGAVYTELKDLVKKYRKADSREAKERIHARTQELMGQLFDAKVQLERRRIEIAEERLAREKRKVAEMQSHKQDLVHKGARRVLDQGELPEWAPKRDEGMMD